MTGEPVARHVQVDGVWYRPGDVPPPEVAAQITNPKAWGGKLPAPPEPDQFDPDGHTVAEVQEHLAGLPEGDPERQRILDAEQSGKARQGIVGS